MGALSLIKRNRNPSQNVPSNCCRLDLILPGGGFNIIKLMPLEDSGCSVGTTQAPVECLWCPSKYWSSPLTPSISSGSCIMEAELEQPSETVPEQEGETGKGAKVDPSPERGYF
ncbi:hypothetical protein Trydic_g2701 [Trypoxylus dichotomus]